MRREFDEDGYVGGWTPEVLTRDPDLNELPALIDLCRDINGAVEAFGRKATAAGVSKTRAAALISISLLLKASRECREFAEGSTGRFGFERLASSAHAMDLDGGKGCPIEGMLEEERELCAAQVDRRFQQMLAAAAQGGHPRRLEAT